MAGVETHLVVSPPGQQTRRAVLGAHGEVQFPAEPTQVAGEVYLDEAELHSYQAGKVVYNCLLADRFAKEDRPVKGDLQNGWPRELFRPRCVVSVTRPSCNTPNRRK
jgi:hypothetical protein